MKKADISADLTYWLKTFSTDNMGNNYGLIKMDPLTNTVLDRESFMYEADRERFMIDEDIVVMQEPKLR